MELPWAEASILDNYFGAALYAACEETSGLGRILENMYMLGVEDKVKGLGEKNVFPRYRFKNFRSMVFVVGGRWHPRTRERGKDPTLRNRKWEGNKLLIDSTYL